MLGRAEGRRATATCTRQPLHAEVSAGRNPNRHHLAHRSYLADHTNARIDQPHNSIPLQSLLALGNARMTSKLRRRAIVAAHAKLAPSPSAVGCSIFAPACSPVPGNMHRCVGMGVSSDAPPPHVRAPCSRALHAHTPRPGRRASHAILREGAIVATSFRVTRPPLYGTSSQAALRRIDLFGRG